MRRRDAFREKIIAANVDQAAVLISSYPAFDEALLMRLLLGLTAEDIPVLVLVTKQDLSQSFEQVQARTRVYESLGYPMLPISALKDPASLEPVQERLVGKRTVLLGQSGMGKSTLLNALVPTASQQTNEISTALSSGRHTTTFSRAFILPDGQSWLIDTPGFQQFELAHLSRWQLLHAMPEFRPYLGQCRFNDCQHHDEPGCAIRDAAERGDIDPHRYELFQQLVDYD
ncbi:ribosome small subunit-dependent GTPase A [Lautropia mirabilis]